MVMPYQIGPIGLCTHLFSAFRSLIKICGTEDDIQDGTAKFKRALLDVLYQFFRSKSKNAPNNTIFCKPTKSPRTGRVRNGVAATVASIDPPFHAPTSALVDPDEDPVL